MTLNAIVSAIPFPYFSCDADHAVVRKSRLQSSDLAKERDALNTQIQALQTQLRDAQDDSARLRRSMQEEKQTAERRLEEERKARERARAQLDQRMEDMQKRKSKFVCM